MRKGQQYSWDDFPTKRDADGWHCRKCGVLLPGRKRAWCSKQCLKDVLLLVEWRYIRACILRRDKYKCVLCGKWASDVDHIIELADGGSFHEWSNLRSLCHECHKSKTLAMRRTRAAKRKAQKKAQASIKHAETVMGENFKKIKAGSYFIAGGERYLKVDELVYEDGIGLQRYIGTDPDFDRKIEVPQEVSTPVPQKADSEADSGPDPEAQQEGA